MLNSALKAVGYRLHISRQTATPALACALTSPEARLLSTYRADAPDSAEGDVQAECLESPGGPVWGSSGGTTTMPDPGGAGTGTAVPVLGRLGYNNASRQRRGEAHSQVSACRGPARRAPEPPAQTGRPLRVLPARPDEPFLGNVARLLLSPAVHQHPLLQQPQQRQGQGPGLSGNTKQKPSPIRTADAGDESCSDGSASDGETGARGRGAGCVRAGAGASAASSSGRAPKPLYGSWQAVTDNPRFLQLFPRRTSVVAQQALESLQERIEQEERLWASPGQGHRDGSGPIGDPWVPHPPPSEDDPADEGVPPELLAARQTALLELMHSLQELSNHLRDAQRDQGSLADSDDSDEEGTPVTLVGLWVGEEPAGAGAGEGLPPVRRPHGDEEGDGPESARRQTYGSSSASCSGSADGKGLEAGRGRSGACKGNGDGGLGRNRTAPGGRRRFRPEPPWDDKRPFQTGNGVVFHYWRLCPYG